MATPAAGYLWDHCQRHGVTYKCYGEGASSVPNANRGTWPAGRDTARRSQGLDPRTCRRPRRRGELPQFMIMSLGENHTRRHHARRAHARRLRRQQRSGRRHRSSRRPAKSKFWNEMAIFIVEDDAQNGPDHVDSHRTVGLVISPYCKRGVVDSTLYTRSA